MVNYLGRDKFQQCGILEKVLLRKNWKDIKYQIFDAQDIMDYLKKGKNI